MSEQLHTLELGSIAVREDAEEGRTIDGYAVRWDDRATGTAEYPGLREGFDRGAFAEAIAARGDRPHPFMNRHYKAGGVTVGAVQFSEDEVGLRVRGKLLNTQAAKDYAEEARAMGAAPVSLEFVAGQSKRKGRDEIIHTRVGKLAAIAAVPYGAYQSATVAVRDDTGGQDVPEITELSERVDALEASVTAGPIPLTEAQTIDIARRVAEDVSRAIAERGGTQPAHPFANVKNLGEAMIAAQKGELPRNFIQLAAELAERALDDVVTTGGVNAALLTNNLTVREVAGIVSRGRPAITAFGGPAPISDVGLSVTWPYYDGTLTDMVGAQSAQKAEILGTPVDIKLGTEALVTYAGGADIAYQLIRQGDPSILEIFSRIVLTAWGVVTDAAFVTELETGSVTLDWAEALASVDFTELVGHTITASVTVETATGQPAEFLLASTTAFTAFAKLIAAASTTVVTNGDLDLRNLRLMVGNIPLIHVPSLTAGKTIYSNRLAARWHEAGPFLATAEDVAKLGRNVAYWSMGAGARYIPAGIVEAYDVAP
jgi:HK97 family phage prohead protease